MRRTVLTIIGIFIVIVAGWWINAQLTGRESDIAQPESATDVQQQDDLANVIWASGKLEPLVWADLSPASNGAVHKIHVAEGDWVEQGTILVELDNAVLRGEVAIAEANVAEANAALALLLADAPAAEVSALNAEVANANAALQVAIGQMHETNGAIEMARAQHRTAQLEYSELASHPTQSELTAATADVEVAQAAVKQAQAAYNLVRGDPQLSARPEARSLYEATAALEAAQAHATLATEGATQQQLAVAASRIDAALAGVEAVESQMPGVEAHVQSALARIASANAALDTLLAGATNEEIAIAEAQVQSAEAALASAEARLNQSQVIAPFDGQVGAIYRHLGEQAVAGQPLVLLGDTRQMHVETTDLRETDVVRLALDMPVEVTFDAMPEHIFAGTITEIASVSTAEKGSTNYTVELELTNLDEELRWGMTAFVNIQAPQLANQNHVEAQARPIESRDR